MKKFQIPQKQHSDAAHSFVKQAAMIHTFVFATRGLSTTVSRTTTLKWSAGDRNKLK